MRGTTGGDCINNLRDVSARKVDMDVIKVLLNAVVSDLKWMTADVVES